MKKAFFKKLFQKKGDKHVGNLKADAAKGDAEAQYQLGLAYSAGNGVTQDYVEAIRWFRASAEGGHAEAQNALGLCYDNGTGVPQDYAEAEKWYRLAVEQGYASAQTNLGLLYVLGNGVPLDYVEALMWWNLAAAQDDEDAIANRDIVAGLMTPSQIEEAQRLAREWSAAHPQDQEHAYFAYHLQGTRNNRSLVVGQRCGQSQSLGKTAIARWEHEQRSAA